MPETDFFEKAVGDPEMSHYPSRQGAIIFLSDFSSVHLFISCQAIMSGHPVTCSAGDVTAWGWDPLSWPTLTRFLSW